MLKNDIRFLGVGGGRHKNGGSTCVQVTESILIDAGNIISTLGDDAQKIEHIFLTHSHLDHIVDLAFLVDNMYGNLEKPIKIYGLKETLEALQEHLFNDTIWPNFKEISLASNSSKVLEFVTIEPNCEYRFDDVTLEPVLVHHTVPTCAYVIKKENFGALFATDTYHTDAIWERIDLDDGIDSLIIDVSFPSKYEKLSKDSGHLTPKLLKEELKKLQREIDVFIIHIKPQFRQEIIDELQEYALLDGRNRVLKDGEFLKNKDDNIRSSIDVMSTLRREKELDRVMEISTALSKERDLNKILDMILKEAISYTGCEGGTIYLKEDDRLTFKTLINHKLNIFVADPKLPSINLYNRDRENLENISAIAALKKQTFNIPNIYIYNINGVSFEGAKKFDKANNYKTVSMLVIPMLNQDDEVIGVLQLINKKDEDGRYIEFGRDDIKMTTVYSNWVAAAITKNRLISDLENLFVSFLESISVAMSAKSPYGNDHVFRVAELMKNISRKIDEDQGFFKEISYTKEQLKELEIAAWIHDIGKISTPDYLLDKATKLQMVYDRIEEIKVRFSYVKALLKSQMLEKKLVLLMSKNTKEIRELEENYKIEIATLDDALEFVETINRQEAPLSKDQIKKIEQLSKKTYIDNGETMMLLSQDEIENLSIKAGTFTEKERQKMNEHAKVSLDMMKTLTFPKQFSRVKEIACAHHEKLNGKGYPLGLKEEEISFEGRLMAVLDIFEALTAHDRAYKTPKTVDQTLEVLENMANRGELDTKIVSFLKESKAYLEYAKKYLLKEQYEECTKV
jgi:HD-GYP domain-containing protein (c-di-GMP phosphodiesterase class II)/ribonuclease BN (tRNA processing enzyme)